jgi:hypothetical protein
MIVINASLGTINCCVFSSLGLMIGTMVCDDVGEIGQGAATGFVAGRAGGHCLANNLGERLGRIVCEQIVGLTAEFGCVVIVRSPVGIEIGLNVSIVIST